ncbi:hypothetical protein ACFYT4_22360 [Streptomyces sp. NPDC004609]|uniref:hypothetical protein n=1 Tax=Streptomyces sp. NPDC004609 TaxID=3364704 RepID=UPI00367628A6
MRDLVPLLFLGVGLAVVIGFFTWLASHVRRRGVAGAAITSALASYDEAFRVTAHESHHEIRAQAERKAPVLSPDDQWTPDRGRARRRPAAGSRRPARPFALRLRRGPGRRIGRPRRGR